MRLYLVLYGRDPDDPSKPLAHQDEDDRSIMSLMNPFLEQAIRDLGLNQLTDAQVQDGLEALNGFAGLFGRKWIDDIFGASQSPRVVLFIVHAWQQWKRVAALPGSASLRKRWKEGFQEQGVLSEILVIGKLLGAIDKIELAPKVGEGKVDF